MSMHSPRALRALCCALLTGLVAACGDSPTGPDVAPVPVQPLVAARRVFTYTLSAADSATFGAVLLDVSVAGGLVDSVAVAGGTTEQFEGRTLVVLPAAARTATLRVVAGAGATGVTLAVREVAGGDGNVRDGANAVTAEPVK